MTVSLLHPVDTRAVGDLLLDSAGRLRPVPAAELARLPYAAVRLWCHENGIYGLPTTELVEDLRRIIGNRTAIEIGAGMGVFGRALGIPMTDARTMERPEVRAQYEVLQQPVTRYGADVEHLDAAAAVEKYKPQVVFGSWITQIARAGEPIPVGGGSPLGVDELALLERVEWYVLFGNTTIHGQKELFRCDRFSVWEMRSPAFWSRSASPLENVLYLVRKRTGGGGA
jgi:hypothetical protein